MSYDDLKLPPQVYDIEWEDKRGQLRLTQLRGMTASSVERKFKNSREDIAIILNVEPTE